MNPVSICFRRTFKSSLLTKMTTSHILFMYMLFFSSGECIKLMIPHGLLHKFWYDEFHLPANYVVKQPGPGSKSYTLVFESNKTEKLCDFEVGCVHSCVYSAMECYVIHTVLNEKGLLQLCQDDLINFSVNTSLPLDFIFTTSGKQIIINETERTQNESSWTFTKRYPAMFTLAAFEMHPFQMTIKNTNNTKAIAYINYRRPKYPFDDYAYEFMVMNHTQYSSYEFGLLLTISLVIDELRTYLATADDQY